jgi:hypothetical protein
LALTLEGTFGSPSWFALNKVFPDRKSGRGLNNEQRTGVDLAHGL